MTAPAAPTVSVVVATHDQGAWLDDAIDSVRAQTFGDWELVVVDDGSTDETPEVMDRHADDPRIRYVTQPRQERAVARNRGLAETSGRLVAFLDADDLWRPEKLAKQVAALDAEPEAALCYTVARFVDEAGERLALRKPAVTIAGRVFPTLMRGNQIILASVVVRRACLDAVGGFDPAMVPCEDWDLWLRLARRWPVTAVDEELTLYRTHPGNTSWRAILGAALRVVDKHYDDASTAAAAGVSRATVRALHYWTSAAWATPDRRGGRLALALRALRESPSTAWSRPGAAAVARLLGARPSLGRR